MKVRVPKIRTYKRHNRWWVDFYWQRDRKRWPAGDTEQDADTLKARVTLAVTEKRFEGRRSDVDAEETTAPRKRLTFAKLCDLFLARHADHKKSSSFYHHTVNSP